MFTESKYPKINTFNFEYLYWCAGSWRRDARADDCDWTWWGSKWDHKCERWRTAGSQNDELHPSGRNERQKIVCADEPREDFCFEHALREMGARANKTPYWFEVIIRCLDPENMLLAKHARCVVCLTTPEHRLTVIPSFFVVATSDFVNKIKSILVPDT